MMDDWRPISTAPKDQVAILGWWYRGPSGYRGWEVDIDIPHSSAKFWLPLSSLPKPPDA